MVKTKKIKTIKEMLAKNRINQISKKINLIIVKASEGDGATTKALVEEAMERPRTEIQTFKI